MIVTAQTLYIRVVGLWWQGLDVLCRLAHHVSMSWEDTGPNSRTKHFKCARSMYIRFIYTEAKSLIFLSLCHNFVNLSPGTYQMNLRH